MSKIFNKIKAACTPVGCRNERHRQKGGASSVSVNDIMLDAHFLFFYFPLSSVSLPALSQVPQGRLKDRWCLLSRFSHVLLFAPPRLYPTRFLCRWDSPGKNTGVGCHALLQGIFPTQRLNLHLLCLLPLAVRFSHSDFSDSLRPQGLQHARPPCPSSTPGVYSSSCPPCRWCHSTISSSVVPFFSCLPSIFPSNSVFSSESVFQIRWPKYWSFNSSIGTSNEYSDLVSFRIDWLDLLAVQRTLKSLLQYHGSKASTLWCSPFFMVQLSHPYMTTGKIIALTRWTFVGKVISLLFNMLSRLVIAFLPRSKHLLISWLQSPSALILEPPKIKSVTVSIISPSICHEVMRRDAMIFVFWMLSFKSTFSFSSFTFIKRFFSSSSLSAIRVVSSAYLRLLMFLLAILFPVCTLSSLAFHTMYSA